MRPPEDAKEKALGLILTTADATPQEQAEQSLRESEKLLRAIAANYPAYLSIIDRYGDDMIVGFTSGREFRRLGLDPEGFVGLPIAQVFHEHTPVVAEYYLRAFGGEEVSFELYFNNQYQRYNVVPLLDEHGEVRRILSVVENITDRRRAEELLRQSHAELESRVQERTAELSQANEQLLEEIAERKRVEGALRSSEERFRQLAENIDNIFWMIEPNSLEVLYVSPHYELVSGRSCTSLYDRPDSFLEVVHPEDRERVGAAFRDVREGSGEEYRIVRPDGSVRWATTHAFPILDQTGRLYRVAGITKDITEERQSQVALIEAERLAIVGKLAASLAHEVNNPLQAAIGCLDLALEALANQKDAQPYLEVVADALDRTTRVVAELKDLGRQSQVEAKRAVDLNLLVDRVLLLTRAECSAHAIEVSWAAGKGLPQVEVMPDAMQQVFLNLVLNAIDAMPEGGRLCVSMLRTDLPPAVGIRFADTGAGISVDAISRVFDPFYSTKAKGLGLGLFISQSIVQQHRGQIDVHSEEGAGTTFTVWLPA